MSKQRLIDANATVKYLREFRCADCDRRKGLKNGEVRFCYEIGDAPCRACDIGDTIEYFIDEDISPTIDAIPVEWLRKWPKDLREGAYVRDILMDWQKEQEAR